ncbi:hypothetical protein ABFS83_09G061100 [Erythranthe nasuta]
MVDVVVSGVALRLAELIEKQIRNKVNLLNTIGNLLDGAERREFKDKSVKDWLRKLEDTSYEMDDVLDEWNISIIQLQQKKVVIRHDIALKIKERDQFDFVTSRPIYASRESWREVCGRDFEKENLIGKLVVGDVGPGGIGKTTLAKLAYNDSRFGIANGIIEGAGGSKPNTNQLDMLLQCLGNSISGKKFLLVLDDVWTEDDTKWEPLKNTLKHGGAGSKILVTTRNQRVVVMMGQLSHDECWEEREKVENIGKAIARKCKGLPLAAKTLGKWEDVLDSEIWVLEEIERCFSYCGVFPKDTEIDVEGIVTKWINGGDWKVRGREYFDKLAMRSLFQDFNTNNGGVGAGTKKTSCQTYYHSLFNSKELPDPHLCDCLARNKFHNEDIKYICNLYNLKFVCYNNLLKELPETLCNLCELETLNVNGLVNLKHIYNSGTESLVQYPQGLGELTGLVTLSRFVFGEKCWSELGLLKNLNRLSGCLELRTYSDYIVEDEVAEEKILEHIEVAEEKILEHIREAELGKKKHIQELRIYFSGHEILVDALEPHPNLQILYITLSYVHRLPKWITSPHNQLKSITLSECTHLSSLPSLGKLPLLENFEIKFETVCDSRLEFVGREFLGITTTITTWDLLFENCSSSSNTIAFPKLKKLQFRNCRRWREWEDITAEEEHSAAVALMPCLTELIIRNCWELAKLPHRLLRKASTLESLHIYGSTQLERFYVERKGQPWKSISISHQNPHFVIKHF